MLWKKWRGKVEEEILDKYKIEETQDPEVERRVLGKDLSWLKECSVQRNEGIKARQTEDEEVRQQRRLYVMR